MKKCINEIISAAKGAITKKEAKQIIDEIERRFNAQMPKKEMTLSRKMELKFDPASMSTAERMQFAAEEAFNDHVREKQNKVKQQQLQVQIISSAQREVAKSGEGVKGVQEYLLKDVAGKITGETELLMAELYKGLEPFMFANQGKLSHEQQLKVLTAIMDADLLKKAGHDMESLTPEERLAYQFRLIENQVYNRKKAAGSDINYLPGHFPQAWEPASVRWFGLSAMDKLNFVPGRDQLKINRVKAKAQEAWSDFILPLVDRSKYVNEETGLKLTDEEMKDVLRDVWSTLASHGLSGKPDAAMGNVALADSLTAHREIHFNSPEAFLEANNAFGSRDLFTAMASGIKKHATEIALLETLGPNPDSGFKSVLQYGKSSQADKNTFGREGSTMAEMIYNEIKGTTNMVGEDKFELVSRVMQGARNLITSAKLGMLPASQIVDLATFHAIAQSDGLGAGDELRMIGKFLNPANKIDRDMAKFHGMLAQSIINDVALRYGESSKGNSWTAKMADKTVTWSGAKFWTDSLKQAFQVLVGKHMADNKGVEFANLETQFRSMLERHGITEYEWEIIRQSEAGEIGGYDVFTPVMVSKVQTAEGSRFMQSGKRADVELSRQSEQFVRDVAGKVAAMMNEEADVAVLSPGFREKAIVKWGTKPGEIPGEFMRSIFLFKTFSIAHMTKVMPRVFSAEYGSAQSRASLGAQLLIGMMITGAAAVQLKEIWKGRNPRDMTKPAFWGAAFMQAGGVGIFGDFLFADANRFGGGFVSTIGGPVAGLISDLQKLTVGNAAQAADGKKRKKDPVQDLAGDTIQLVKNYAPLMNLWYTRLALDHLLFFHVQEAVNPGYLRRMERRVKHENNQSFWWNPSDATPGALPDLSTVVPN